MTSYIVDFEPAGRRGECQHDETLLDCARRLGVGIASLCDGQGTCGSCKVRLASGSASKPTSRERETFSTRELKNGWRLACQTYPASDCKLNVPPDSMLTTQRTQVEGLEVAVAPEPPVVAYHVRLQTPSLTDPQADADRLLDALKQQHGLRCRSVDIEVLRTASPLLRSWKWSCQASVRQNEVVALGRWPSRQLGLAVDLGTTKIAAYLVDLSNGATLAAKGVMNPQISYGEDVISRIIRVLRSPAEGVALREVVVKAVNELVHDLCQEADAEKDEIVEAVVVGNTAMHHLFLGLPVKQLALSPFVPAASMAEDIKARDVGLHLAPGACLHLLPNIAGFVGADHVAMLLATEAWKARGATIAIDIGTNTEVSLAAAGRVTTVSCASGPAFEGGHIKDGMRAAPGAIERLRIVDGAVQYQTVDEAPPVGICGSGVLDALAQLHLAGILNEGGRMKDSHPRVRTRRKQREFVLVGKGERADGGPDIVLTQGDVRELQLAKAAIRTGIQVLLETNGRAEEDIGQVIIAGAFGSYIDVASAIAIGMLPSLPLDRFRQVGNAAGMGAKLALTSRSSRARARKIASKVEYAELASAPDFNEIFVAASYLGRYRIRGGKREPIDGD